MLDEIGAIIGLEILRFVVRVVSYPIALGVCTPFILIRAFILVLLKRQKFRYAVSDGYGAISDAWWP